jgi:hypothetical protein
VRFERHFLAQVDGEKAQLIHSPRDLLDGLFARNIAVELVGKYW